MFNDMNKQKAINIGIDVLGWLLIAISALNLASILFLFSYSKEGIFKAFERGEIPSVDVPIISMIYILIGKGILKKRHTARSAFVILAFIGLIVGVPFLIYKNRYGPYEMFGSILVIIPTIFLMMPKVKESFNYDFDLKRVKQLPIVQKHTENAK